jgi:hypothetical protein
MLTVNSPVDIRRFYVGVRSCKVEPEQDVKYLGSCRPMKAWMKTQPVGCVEKMVLSRWESRAEALAHEILLHDCFDVGANPEFWNRAKQTAVGFDTAGTTHVGYNKGMTWTDEQKAAQSIRLKGRVITPETRAKISAAQKGRKMPEERRLKFVGKKASPETLKKLRESHLGQTAWNKGKPPSEETRNRLSVARLGVTPWNKGKTASEESKLKMSEAAKRRSKNRNEKGQFL